MSLGASRSYKQIIQLLTDEPALSMNGLLEYFQPLHEWLLQQNHADNAEVNWNHSGS